jgi:hypothetical protein
LATEHAGLKNSLSRVYTERYPGYERSKKIRREIDKTWGAYNARKSKIQDVLAGQDLRISEHQFFLLKSKFLDTVDKVAINPSDISETDSDGECLVLSRQVSRSSFIPKPMSGLNFEQFRGIMTECELPMLATRDVFEIFDHEGGFITEQVEGEETTRPIGDDLVNYHEFLLLLATFRDVSFDEALTQQQQANLIYDICEISQSHEVTSVELVFVLKSMMQQDVISENDLYDLFARIDESNDGLVSREEFCKWFMELMSTVSATYSMRTGARGSKGSSSPSAPAIAIAGGGL